MGARFDLGSANIVSYLIAGAKATVPRLTREQLRAFLHSLAIGHSDHRPRLISASPEWLREMADRSERILADLHSLDVGRDEPVDADQTKRLLDPLAEAFGRYDVYILPVGSWRHQEVLDRFGDNHDQRVFGNSFLGIGRRLRQLAELEMRPIHPMPEQKLVFFCFDSSRTGDLARGAVERDQLLHMGATYDVENAHGGLADHLKIALVHHHPHPYTPEKEVPIIDPRSWVGREEFIEFRGAPGFLSWCAARDIGLVLHGHKHIPRLVHDRAPIGPEQDAEHREITSVGCGSSLGANGRDLSFNIIEWRPESQSWSVDFRLATGDGRPFRSAAIDSHIQLVDRR